MDPQKLVKVVRRWLPVVAAITLAGGAGAYGISRALPRTYLTHGYVLVVEAPRGNQGTAFELTANQVTSTYATLMTQPSIIASVKSQLHLPESVDALSKVINVSAQRDTQLLDVAVSDPTPARAARIDNALITTFVNKISNDNQAQIQQAGSALQSQIDNLQTTLTADEKRLAALQSAHQDTSATQNEIQADNALLAQLTNDYSSFRIQQDQALDAVSVGELAPVPTLPDSPKITLNTILGALLGLFLGLGIATLGQYFDQGLRTEEDVTEKLGLTTLAIIPRFDGNGSVRWRGGEGNDRHLSRGEWVSEAYRRLRTNVMFSGVDGTLTSIMLTSARAGEGKTITASNFASAMAAADQRVLLIDADMRRPRQHQIFDKPLRNGLSEMLLRSRDSIAPTMDSVHETDRQLLHVLTSGTIPPNPSELLSAKHVPDMFRGLERHYDLVVIDTPPVGAVTDACSVASRTSGTIIVIEAGKTSARQVRETVERLRQVGANILGVVLNKSRQSNRSAYYYKYYDGDQGSGDSARTTVRRRRSRGVADTTLVGSGITNGADPAQ